MTRRDSEAITRRVTIRFPQCDPAGIVFYPRYFEMLLRQFPDAPVGAVPVAVRTRFLRPNRLGDTIELRYRPGEPWSVSGCMDGDTCFLMEPLENAPPVADDAHRPGNVAFRTVAEAPGAWALGPGGRLHLSRYFEYLNMAIEEWFEDALGMDFAELHVGRKIGIPTVQFDTIVRDLPTSAEAMSIWIRPTRVGGKSLSFKSWLVAEGRTVVVNEQVVVFVEMLAGGYRSIEIPGNIRTAFARRIDGGA